MTEPRLVLNRVFGAGSTRSVAEVSNQTIAEWDSFGHISLIAEIEAAYGLELSAEEALEMTDLDAIERVLAARGVRW